MYYLILDIKNNSYQFVDLKTKDFLTALDRLFIGKADTFYNGTGKKVQTYQDV